jgi:hypothetical protein
MEATFLPSNDALPHASVNPGIHHAALYHPLVMYPKHVAIDRLPPSHKVESNDPLDPNGCPAAATDSSLLSRTLDWNPPVFQPAAEERWITPNAWDPHRANITRLYRDENRHLRDVMRIMARDHGIRATCVKYLYTLSRYFVLSNAF